MFYDPNKELKPNLTIIYKNVDGLHLPMRVFYPVDGLKEKNKAVLCIHGGGWTGYKEDQIPWKGNWMRHQAMYFARKGYVGIEISYRSIDIPGVDVFDLMEDCEDAMRYITENLTFVDGEYVMAIGDSAGGHLALCLAHSDDYKVRPRAVVACNPVTDLTCGKWDYVSAFAPNRRKASPMFNINKLNSKLLVIHGTDDSVVAYKQSVEYVEAMRGAGNDITLVPLKGVDHAFILFGYKSTDQEANEYMSLIENYLPEMDMQL